MHDLAPSLRMTQYRTEIVVPPDRCVALQLPPGLPEGPATVTVVIHALPEHQERPSEEEPESQDIEWWEEFEGE